MVEKVSAGLAWLCPILGIGGLQAGLGYFSCRGLSLFPVSLSVPRASRGVATAERGPTEAQASVAWAWGQHPLLPPHSVHRSTPRAKAEPRAGGRLHLWWEGLHSHLVECGHRDQ